jgi:hypothetical protein
VAVQPHLVAARLAPQRGRAEIEKVEPHPLFQFVGETVGQKDARNVRFRQFNPLGRLDITNAIEQELANIVK